MSNIDAVEKPIREHFGEQVLDQTKAGLATLAAVALAGSQKPTALIYVGPSGSSKTLTCSFLSPDSDHPGNRDLILRLDKFTPKSFVSHAANVKADQLKEIDLLPKIEDRCLITKELAPLFRGNKDELQETFSILIAVLDGKGYVSSSGVRGTRGYDRDINFSWIGATTPLTNEVHRVMAQLGTRLVFYQTGGKERTEDELIEFASNPNVDRQAAECQAACNEFIAALFDRHPRRSVDVQGFVFPEDLLRDLVRHAMLMCHLRAGFGMAEERNNGSVQMRYSKPEREVPYRAITILKNIAMGSALIHGRREIDEYDLKQIRHIAYSSMPEQRRLVFQALVDNGGHLDTQRACELAAMSKPTARHYMEELGHLGVATFEPGSVDNTPSYCELLKRWEWAIKGPKPEQAQPEFEGLL